jgi:hypothetical protein
MASSRVIAPDRGELGPPIVEKRRKVTGILWVLRTDAPWRDVPKTLACLGPPADDGYPIVSTIMRAHQHAAA